MLDRFNRDIYYLRIAVTDRCNLRCTYCMPARRSFNEGGPEEGIKLKSHDDILSYEEIDEIVKTAVKLGFNKFRLTGGEPLIRRNILNLVKRLVKINGVETLAIRTLEIRELFDLDRRVGITHRVGACHGTWIFFRGHKFTRRTHVP